MAVSQINISPHHTARTCLALASRTVTIMFVAATGLLNTRSDTLVPPWFWCIVYSRRAPALKDVRPYRTAFLAQVRIRAYEYLRTAGNHGSLMAYTSTLSMVTVCMGACMGAYMAHTWCSSFSLVTRCKTRLPMFQYTPPEYKTGQNGFCFLNFVDVATALKGTPSAFRFAAHNVGKCTTKIKNHRCELFFSIFLSANDVGYCIHLFAHNVGKCTRKIQNHRCELFGSVCRSAKVYSIWHRFFKADWQFSYASTSAA